MTQKRTDLAKKAAEQLTTRMRQEVSPDRFGKAAGRGGKGQARVNPLIAGLLKKAPAPEK